MRLATVGCREKKKIVLDWGRVNKGGFAEVLKDCGAGLPGSEMMPRVTSKP